MNFFRLLPLFLFYFSGQSLAILESVAMAENPSPILADIIEPVHGQNNGGAQTEQAMAATENPAPVMIEMQERNGQSSDIPYTILPESEKIFTIILVSFAALISPMSSGIYYPALNSLAASLDVSPSTINLTITVYMVSSPLQALSIHGQLPSSNS